MRSRVRIDGVAWNRNDLLAEPPPLAMNSSLYSRVVLARALGVKLDLRRHVRARVLLLEHRDRRELRIAQVALEVGVARALGERRLVVAVGPDQAALLAHDDRGAGVLAHRQHAARRDVGVLEEVVGDELVVVRRLRVLDDALERGEVRGAQQMIDVGERRLRERAQRLARDDDDVLAHDALDAQAVGRDLAVGACCHGRAGIAVCACTGASGGWSGGRS